MKRIIKIIKKVMLGFGIIVGLLIIIGILFVNLSPQFGGKASNKQELAYSKSANYKNGKFFNLGEISMKMSASDMVKAFSGMLKKIPNSKPGQSIEVEQLDSTALASYTSKTRVIWFGHSAFLLQMNGKNILIDPMFGDVPAPHPMLGSRRFNEEKPISIEQLPNIDAVLISHNHYDHLDYESIKKLRHKVSHFYTPLGLGNHLLAWGISEEKITELDWWDSVSFQDLTFTSAPAQHFSGRGLTDRDKTLWCSWVIQSDTENIFFSGDSGYGKHFKAIGDKFKAFDFAMIECGQYNELWSEIHMFPEQTAQVGLDLNAKTIMPIHWGAFKLAQHSWTDPIERVSKKAKELNIKMVAPKIGEPLTISETPQTINDWWKNYE